MDEMTIADLAGALRGIPRNAVILIDTPSGPKRLRMVMPTRVAERDGNLVQHAEFERFAIILKSES